MKPESQSEQPFNLPSPQEYGQDWEEGQLPNSEKNATISLEQGISASPPALPGTSSPGLPLASNSANIPASIATITPLMADDADLIEKEWVDKAKDIVNRTKHDPYAQNKEINRVKADYLKKRYNKDIKLSE